MNDLEKFIEFLYGDLSGYVYSPLKRKNNEWDSKFFQWPVEKKELIAWIETSPVDGDVYLAPAIFKERRATKAFFKESKVAWVEFDGQEKIDFGDLPTPNAIIQSSTSTHLHCYWSIEPCNLETLEGINRRLTNHLRADSSGWDATQVLRPPGTTNWKHDLPVELVHFETTAPRELQSFDTAEEPPVANEVTLLEIGDFDEVFKLARLVLAPKTRAAILEGNPEMGSRSHFLMSIAHEMAEKRLTAPQIITLLYHVDKRIKKFEGRDDQLLRLSEITSKALLKQQVEDDPGLSLYSPSEIINFKIELDWLIPGWLHSYGLMIVTGMPSIGKTQLCLDLGYRLATGGPVLNKAAAKPKKIVFLSLEMDAVELQYIFRNQGEVFKTAPQWEANTRVFAPGAPIDRVTYEEIVKREQPNVLIIDSLSELADEELKEKEAKTIMAWLNHIRRTYNTAIIIIHHNRKATDANKKPNSLHDLYGSYMFAKSAETVVTLWADKERNLHLDTSKVRFGTNEELNLIRDGNLTFHIKKDREENASDEGSTYTGKTSLGLG